MFAVQVLPSYNFSRQFHANNNKQIVKWSNQIMDFKRARPRIERKPESGLLQQKYPLALTLYELPPTEDIRLEEFERLALERLQVLRVLEQASQKNLRLLSDDWKEYVLAEMAREGLKGYLNLCTTTTNEVKLEEQLQMRRRDYISHFILRLAYCRADDLSRWFVSRETELFKYRFSLLSNEEIRRFFSANNFHFVPLTQEQCNEVKEGLYESTMSQSVAQIELQEFYKVPFTQVLDLVRSRRCYLKAGQAYVTLQDLSLVVTSKLQSIIQAGLKAAQFIIPQVNTDERLFYLINSMHTSYTGKDYTLNKNATVPVESLDQLSKKSFPLCMRSLHEQLRADHHLKHDGRMQYGLFLKGIGVTLEDSIRFWREEFTKKMDADKFAKNYEYNIHHNYGKKGSMVNYTPYSCMKIIQGNGQAAGCTFKNHDPAVLKGKLLGNGLSQMHVQDIMSFVQKGHYQLACSKYFQVTHELGEEVAITHPNQYFELSQKVMGQRGEDKTRPAVKRKSTIDTRSVLENANDDDELWVVAETQEENYNS